jgi:hypothetical protein
VKPRYRFGPLTAVTVVLLGLFGVVDYVAHATGYTHGATFSALVWHLSAESWLFRVGTAGAIVVLFVHLIFRKP